MITSQHRAVQPAADERPRGGKHTRLGTAEAVDALLRIADDEDRNRLPTARAAARPGIARQPAVQRMPLQRAGVLKLIDQQMAHLGIEPLLHKTSQLSIGQQGQRAALQIVHVNQAAAEFQRLEFGDQPQRQTRHAAVLQPGFVLAQGLLQTRHVVAAHRQGDAVADVLAQRTRQGEQCGKHGVMRVGIGQGQPEFDTAARLLCRRAFGLAQLNGKPRQRGPQTGKR